MKRVQYGHGMETRCGYHGTDHLENPANKLYGRLYQNCVIAQSDPNCPYNGDSYALLNLSNWYDSVGNITSSRDRTNGNQVQWFGYDALDRLTQAYTSATGSGTYSHTNAYSAIGNLTVISGTTQWYSDTAHVHAVTHLGGTRAFWYDANGNAITRTVAGVPQVLAWDGENRLASVTQGGTTYAYAYDGDGNRVKVNAGGVMTAYVNTTYEVNPGTGITTTYYYLGSTRVAMRTAAGVTWLAGDHLGSISLATNAAGQKVSDERYLPYGGTRWGSVPTDYQFTGQMKDGGTGLYYYGARYYDPATGRFISADTIVPSPGRPQALNRYAYVYDNPLKHTDPTGHAPPPEDYAALLQQAIDYYKSAGWSVVGNPTLKDLCTNGADMVFSRIREVNGQQVTDVLAIEVKNLSTGNVNLGTLGKGQLGKYGGSIARVLQAAQRFEKSANPQLMAESQAILDAARTGSLTNGLYTTARGVSSGAAAEFGGAVSGASRPVAGSTVQPSLLGQMRAALAGAALSVQPAVTTAADIASRALGVPFLAVPAYMFGPGYPFSPAYGPPSAPG